MSGGVALVAAIIAPITAHYRQKRALEEEALRLDDQLTHERSLRDLEEVRNRLDDVIDMAEAALSAVSEARLTFNAGNFSAADDQLFQARQALGQFGYKERRVRLRVGHDHVLISRLEDYRQKVQALYDLAHGCHSQRNSVPPDAWDSAMAEIDAAQSAVIDAAEGEMGARLGG